MINFLKETMEDLDRCKKDFYADVLWIGTRDGSTKISHNDFLVMANFEYDNGFGGAEINTNLVLVGKDWWLERGEYDGSEWWTFKQIPELSSEPSKLESLSERY